MTADELAAAATTALGGAVTVEDAYPPLTLDVPADRWVDAARYVRAELGCDFFDWLSAYDALDEGFAVVVHSYALERHHHLALRTRIPREDPRLPTLTEVWPGANWHERETFEMFGIFFDGHPRLVPLLLPDGFVGHPLRKEFILAARVAKPWPGAKEPGESEEGGATGRRRMRPPGVPETWGPPE